MPDDTSTDGHTFLFGMDGQADPSVLSPYMAAKAVNRVFRGGKNKTRPPFREMELVFDNEEDRDLFTNGNFQGASAYKKRRPARHDGLICSIAGTIFFLQVCGNKARVSKVFTGNNSFLTHAWFCQAEEWMFIQDGDALPIIWDGLIPSTARRSLGPSGHELPIGTLMLYAQGRTIVTNAYNQVAISDIIYGNGFTDTRATYQFTENLYYAEGGYFSTPADLGDITGIAIIPMQDFNARGQGEVLVLCTNGAYTLDLTPLRETWKDQNIQRVAMIGRGCYSPNSVCTVNGDVWFRSGDGWASYTNSKIDFIQKIAFRKFSREVDSYLSFDTPFLIQYTSHIFFDNRLIGTTRPERKVSGDKFGMHRYSNGMVSLDLDSETSQVGGPKLGWDGLWTGPRPTQMLTADIERQQRAFIFSFGEDGQNRLFELMRHGENDFVNGQEKPIQSFYVTRRFDYLRQGKTDSFTVKRLMGGELWVSGIQGKLSVRVLFRSNNNPCWHELLPERTIQLVNEFPFKNSWPQYARIIFNTPDPDEVEEGHQWLAAKGSQHQISVRLTGSVRVDRARFSVAGNEVKFIGDDSDRPQIFGSLNCEIENDFEYKIA